MTSRGRDACQFEPPLRCDLHKSGMSCKKGDASRAFATVTRVCVAVKLGFAGEECFKGVESEPSTGKPTEPGELRIAAK